MSAEVSPRPARPDGTAPVREPSLVVSGASAGVAVAFATMLVYQAVRIGWRLASEATGSGAVDSVGRVIGVLVLGGLLSLPAAVLAGGVLGAVVGLVLELHWHRLGPVRAWLVGSLVSYVGAVLVNLVVLGRVRREPIPHAEWVTLLGLPSLLFVVVFGGVAVHLYLRRSRFLAGR